MVVGNAYYELLLSLWNKKITYKYLLADSPGQLWFLWMLFDVYVFFWIGAEWFRKHDVLGSLLVLALYCVGTIGKIVSLDLFQIWTAFQCLSFFMIGFKIRQYGGVFIKKIPSYVYLIVDVMLFLLLFYLPDNQLIYKTLKIGITYLLHVTGAIMAFVILQNAANLFNWSNNKIIKQGIRLSMPIYLIHQQIIYVLIWLLNGKLLPLLHGTVNFFGAILISSIIGLTLFRWKITRIMMGEKRLSIPPEIEQLDRDN